MVGLEPEFLCSDDRDVVPHLENSGFPYELIGTKMNYKNDPVHTLRHIRSRDAIAVVLDSYDVNGPYMDCLKGDGFKTIYIDDLGMTDLPCDVVINGLVGTENLKYRSRLALLGKDYAVLSKEYWHPRESRTEEISNVLVTMGGIDHYNLTEKILDILGEQVCSFNVQVVVGPYYENLNEIRRKGRSINKRVILNFSPASLFPLIHECEIAISAGGLTLYELATMGKPTAGISLWPNQERNVRELGREKILIPLYYSEEGFYSTLKTAVDTLIRDANLRRKMSIKAQSLFDGGGALRAARKVAGFLEETM